MDVRGDKRPKSFTLKDKRIYCAQNKIVAEKSCNIEEINRTWAIASYQEDIPNPFIIDPTLVWRVYFSELHPIGDINSDLIIDILDIVLVSNEILSSDDTAMSGLQKHQADMDADFNINVLDILIIVNWIIN